MYAVIETGGKQYKVENGDIVFVEKLSAADDSTVDFKVVAVGGEDGLKIGTPYVDGASVTGKVLKTGKGKKITDQLVAGGSTQTEHGLILHDDVIGKIEGTVILTVHAKREAQVNQVYPEKDKNKPWKSSRAIGGWEYAVMRPRLADYVLSMPRGAQIMYPCLLYTSPSPRD